jgi:Phage derived protein Gp49-like (DUF891)
MADTEAWKWKFLGVETLKGHRPVQSWFDALPDLVREETADLLGHLQNLTDRKWKGPEFDWLEGEPDIREIRPIGREECYRIYGFFGPGKHEFTLLHGTCKDERNDRPGKSIARTRLSEFRQSLWRTHEFNFEEEPPH